MSTPVGQSDSLPATRQVWDLPVRIFHWALVASIFGAYASHRAGVKYFTYHRWCGYTVVVLVCFRILWGVAGTHHARFWNFVRGPVRTASYLIKVLHNSEEPHAGHNPLSAVMIVALLLGLLVQGLCGLFANDEIVNLGPLYAFVSDDQSLALTALHRKLFYWITAAVVLHVAAVIAHHVFKNENLLLPMWTGRKPAETVKPDEEIGSSRPWLAIGILAAIIGALSWFVLHAPNEAVGLAE